MKRAAIILGLAVCVLAGQTRADETAQEPVTGIEEAAQTGLERSETGLEAAQTIDLDGFGPIDLRDNSVISKEAADLAVMTYYGGPDDEVNNYAYEKMRERFPNVTMHFESHPEDGGTIIKARAAAGDLPDILLADSGSIAPLIESGSIVALDDFIELTGYREVLTQGALQTCLYSPDGHIYQFPLGGVSPTLWYYNKAIFEEQGIEIPGNYPELLAAVRQLRSVNMIPCAVFAKEPWPNGAILDSFLMKSYPSGIYGLSTGVIPLHDPTLRGALLKIQALANAGMFQDGSTLDNFDEASARFLGGECAMFINGSWYLASAVEALGDDLGIFETYPTADEGKEEENYYARSGGGDTCGLTITASGENIALKAMAAAVYAYNREVAEYQIANSITVPVLTEGLDTDRPLTDQEQWLRDQLPLYSYGSKYIHTLPDQIFAKGLVTAIQRLISGGSVDMFLQTLG